MKKYFAGALMLFMSIPALAESPDYNYVQLAWQKVELDDNFLDVDGDGFGVAGAFEVADNWHVIVAYDDIGFDFGVDLEELSAGFGYHADISANTSFFGELAFVRFEVSAPGLGSADEDGFGIRIGLRSNVTPNVELEGSASYVDLGDGADGSAVAGAAWYRFTETFAVGLSAGLEEDVTAFGIGARLYF